ncbi:hypothetical protein KEM56_006916 [Ascosphaera pollenicola]|nr:hypothetical protein KEM56_006916 [Ascosphaera pollenicola]
MSQLQKEETGVGFGEDEKGVRSCAASDHGTSQEELDQVMIKKTLKKIDLHLVPFLMLLYVFSFLDRVNIGNARLYGLETDLGLHGSQYQVIVCILFVPYCLLEVPSNLLLQYFHPSRYLATITTLWGIIATLCGVTQNYAGIICCRIALGIVEAGLFPGLVAYMTLWYSKKEIALRIGYLFSSAAIAGAFGGLLAYAIGHMDGVSGQSGWRWIFIIEGFPSVVLGGFVLWLMADNPDTAWFLTSEEKKVWAARRALDIGQTDAAQRFHKEDAIEGALDWKVHLCAFAQIGVDSILYGYSTFLPTIIQGFGSWTTPQVQCLTIPCYFVGAVSYILFSWLSDKLQKRGIFIVIFSLISCAGYAILMADVSPGVHYFGCFVVAVGFYVCVGLPLAWLPTNLPRWGKRTFGTGLQLMWGNIAGVITPFVYKTNEAPTYRTGHGFTLAVTFMSACLYGFLSWHYTRVNKRRDEGKENYKIEGLSEEEIQEMGDRNPRFRYTS